MAGLELVLEKKRALDAARPLSVDVVRNLADWFELELLVAFNGLERLGLTREDIVATVERARQRGSALRGRPAMEQRLVANHLMALHLVGRMTYQPSGAVNERVIQALHGLLYQGVEDSAGQYREGPPKEAFPADALPDPAKARISMSALNGWLKRAEPGVETAIESHTRLMNARPFLRGNAAIARLVMNMVLGRAGFPPVVVPTDERQDYEGTIERARISGDKGPFRDLMLKYLDQSLDVCLVGAAQTMAERADAVDMTIPRQRSR